MRNDTLVDRLRRHAALQPDARALRFLDGDALAADLSYAELDARIRAVAACLQQNAPAGERAVLLFPSGVDYVVAFHACLYAGLIAVPAYPPERGRAQHAERLRGILRDAEPRLILTTSGLREAVAAELPPGTDARVLAVDAIPQSAAADWREGSPASDSIAFLQYTSGSTSSPKGVRVTHANLEANEIAFTTGFGMSRDDVFVSWLPLYHDMGLIGGLIQPLHLGIPAVLMSPKSFVERPRRWLEAFARFGGTVSGAPDFAYALCADRIGEAAAAELDLSSWRLAFNGAEFVRAATLERFAKRFAPSGFSERAFFPCYGLAEATLFVSGGVRGEGAHVGSFEPTALASGRVTAADSGTRHVALGHTPPGHALRIMREDGAGPAEPDAIGEIRVSGPSVADGYWRNEAATEAAFVTQDGTRWLRTGDLGFERDGRLYVTGRIKDMLIVRGENLFPQDIEQAVEAEVEAVRRGRVAAFPVEIEGHEGIGVAAEFGRGVTKLLPAEAPRDAIAKAVARQCGEAPAVVVILNPRGMPLTTSGKLQRSACAALWAKDDGLDAVAVFVGGLRRGERALGVEAPLSGTEAIVAETWSAVLGRERIGREDDFFLLGGNSIAAAQAAAALRERCGIELDLGAFFAHPTLRALAAHVDGLPRTGAGAVSPVTAADRTRPLALSHAQARLWFLWQMEPASTAYTVAASIHLKGALDAGALLGALEHVVARHEALRTTFEAGEGGAIQIVHPQLSLPIAREDLSGLDPSRRAEALERLTAEALAKPFDLTSGPLLRAALIRLGHEEHALLLTAHHIVIDGVSMGVLLDELAALYSGATPVPLGVQYADCAAWQRDWLGAGEGERQLGFWREALGREHPVLALPLDRPRPAVQSHRGDSVALPIDARLAGRLRALAASERASVFMVLHAAYALLLHRYTGEHDIRIGVPTANRRLKSLERLIGFFVNTLVLRTGVEPGQSFAELVAATKRTTVAALAHQDVPFERLVEDLQPERSLGHNPLFQAKFNYMAEPRGFDTVEGLDATVRILDLAGAHFDLALDILDGPEGMTATFNYATDLFDRATIEGLAAQFADLLSQAAEAPSRALHDFTLLERSRQQATAEEAFFPAETVLDLFRRVALANPGATALADAGGTLSYAGLDARSDALAGALLAWGIAPEAPVGLLIERSMPFVVGLLGAMKAGAAVVLLDPSWPEGRVRAVLDDAGVGLLLSAGPALPMARASGHGVLDVAAVEEASSAPLPPAPDPRRIAYIVYTSGSTGRPKGVAVAHGALANYVQAILARLAPEPGWSMAMASTVAADLGHTVLFGALCCGASLSLVPSDDAFDAERFAARMREKAIDVLKIVPSHLIGLLGAETSGDVLPRRVLVLGGEALDPALAAEIRRLRPSLRIVNHYGPTETTVGVLSHEIAPDSTDAAVPLGLPLANLRAHLLDASLGPVPNGVSGELLIGGAGLARGYQGAPALTAERFVPDPFGPPGSRLYRTGDRVRGDREGRLHFLGRGDDQIKLRGYRIEPGEIARVLLARDDVREAVVLAQAVPADEERRHLVAYVTPAAGASPDAAALKEQLAASLPDYMVPAHVIVLERLPLTGNGKVDRKALPLPEAAEPGRRRDAPEGEVEEAMAEVWAQVLRLDEVGATDNFFELGGDSILSLQVIARLRKRGIKLTPKQIFDRQTIRSLAAVAGTAAPKAPAPAAAPAMQAIPLLPIQDRFFAEVRVDRHHWNQALLLTPREPLDAEALARALKATVERHDALRLRFTEGPAGWTATPGALDARPDLLRRASVADRAAATALCAEAQASLDLAAGRLVQALLLDVAGAGQRLLIAIHHLAVDGVSWRILLEDIATAYAQAKAGEPIALGAGTDSVATWASRLHALAASGTLSSELPFWLGQNAEGIGPLPSDREPQAPQTLADADTLVTEFDTDLTASLLAKAPAAYRTQVNDLLLAALLRALGRWSGASSALVELEGHGREDVFAEADISRTVGWFTTVFPLRLDGASAETGDLVRNVKERLRALPNRGLGFGLLSRFGTAEQRAALARLPEPQITFNYLGQFDASFGADALLARAEEDAGPSRSPRAPLARALVVDGDVRGGRLRLSWRYGRARHDRATVERLAALYGEALREVVAHCTSGAGGLTPSDLPLCGLDQRGLDAFLARTGLDPRRIEDVYPLSPTQQGILFHALGDDEGSRAYVNQIAVTVSGLDPARIMAAWEAATRRHAVLRTSIHWQGIEGAALQVVHRDPALPFTVEDGTDIVQAERADREAGFALEQAPLQRVRLIRLGTAEDGAVRHRLIWTTHHVLMDGWSSARLMAEIMAEADGEARSEGTAGRYRDYIAWLGTRDRAAAETFWRDQLARLEEPTRLADALLREESAGSGQSSGQGSARTGLDGEAFAALQAFARRERVTLNTLVQGAWALLVRRLNGQDAVAFGATVAGRPAELPGAQETLGLFIATLPIVDRAAPDVAVGTWLRALQDRNLATREHEHLPLQEIQRLAGRPGQPLFDSIVVFENYPVDEALKAPAFTELRHVSATNYPLTLSAFATPERLDLHLDHDLGEVSASAASLLAGLLTELLGTLATDAERRLGTIALGRPSADAGPAMAAGGDLASHLPMHLAFARQARERPDAEALRCGTQSLTYAALDARASRLAHALAAHGIGPGAVVGVAMPRTAALVVALVAVLKTGAAYAPLDPATPPKRLVQALAGTRAALLLAEPPLRARLTERPCRVRSLAELEASVPQGAAADVAVHPESLAYVIHTSGSTGTPKGVAVAHGPFAMHCAATAALYETGPASRELLFLSFAFDAAHERLWSALSAGASVVLRDDALWTPEQTLDTLARERCTHVDLPPAYLRELAAFASERGNVPRLEVCSFGGEAMPASVLEDVAHSLSPRLLINGYGPTETVVTPLAWKVPASALPPASGPSAPIGQAVGARHALLLDADAQPLPAGATAELFVGGEGLAQSYLGQPSLTAERFLPDPFGAPGSRMYRTGDRAAQQPDGTVLYRGRSDDQVKIRGHRIEPGEVEARLRALPGVASAAVIARPGPAGLRLIAYAVPEAGEGAALDGAALRAALAETLPGHMVPSHVVVLAQLPITPGGKVDRRALPEPDAPDTAAHVAPRTDTERALAAIWRAVLGLDRIGVTDRFFDIGGDSIQAIRVVSRMRERFDRPLTPKDVFDTPTIEELARRLDAPAAGPRDTAKRLDALLAAFEDA